MIRVALALVRSALQVALQYRSDFLFEALTGLLRTVGAVAPLWIVYNHTTLVAGFSRDESLLVMAFFLLLSAFFGGLMEPNLGAVVEAVRTGTLDLWLLKPADAQLLVSVRRVDPAYLWDLLASIGVGAWALTHLGAPGWTDVLVAAWTFVCGLAAMYGVWILGICTSFFWVRVDNLRYLLMSAADAGRWPVRVFSSWLRLTLTAIIPVAVVTSFPADALRGAWDASTPLVATAIAAMFLIISRLAWQRSLAFYTSASS